MAVDQRAGNILSIDNTIEEGARFAVSESNQRSQGGKPARGQPSQMKG